MSRLESSASVGIEEAIQSRVEIGISEWICHLRSTHPPWEGPGDIIFAMTIRNKFVNFFPLGPYYYGNNRQLQTMEYLRQIILLSMWGAYQRRWAPPLASRHQ